MATLVGRDDNAAFSSEIWLGNRNDAWADANGRVASQSGPAQYLGIRITNWGGVDNLYFNLFRDGVFVETVIVNSSIGNGPDPVLVPMLGTNNVTSGEVWQCTSSNDAADGYVGHAADTSAGASTRVNYRFPYNDPPATIEVGGPAENPEPQANSEFMWFIDGTVTPTGGQITNVTGTARPGSTISVTTSDIGNITSATFGGEACTVSNVTTNNADITISSSTALLRGAQYTLEVSDGADNASTDVTLEVEPGYGYVTYTGPTPVYDGPGETESLHELYFKNEGIAADAGDQFIFSSISGMSVDGQTIVDVVPAQNVNGQYRVIDASTNTISALMDFGVIQPSGEPQYEDPDPFSFTTITDVQRQTLITSGTVAITGLTEATTLSVISGFVSISSGPAVASGMISPGDSIQAIVESSNTYAASRTVDVIIGSVQGSFTVVTELPPPVVGGGKLRHRIGLKVGLGI